MLILLLGMVACADAGNPTDPEFQSSSIVALGLWPEEPTIEVGDSIDFVVFGLTVAGDTVSLDVTWSANGGEIKGTGKGKGRYTAGAVGSNKVKATRDSLSDSTTVTVTPVPVASLAVMPNNATIEIGETLQLTAVVKDADGNELNERPVEWVSANSDAASVNDAGLVTGVAAGFSTIRATSEGQSGTAQVVVTTTVQPVATVDVTPASAAIEVGGTIQLHATPRDAAGNALPGRLIVWSSAARTIATVDGSGAVTGVAEGTADVIATSEGQSGTATVTVSSSPVVVASVDITPATALVEVGSMVQLTATVRDAAGNELTGRAVSWASNNAGVATVTGSGLVSGVATGSATITATSEGQSGTASVTVPQPPGSGVPGDVGDLAVVGQSETTLTLTLTEVDDGEGNPARYAVRFAPPPLNWGQAAGSEFVVAGVQVGAPLEFQVTGLTSGTEYAVQLVAFRGTLNNGAVFSENLSNVATGTTATNMAAVATVEVTPANASIAEGATVQLSATLKDAAGNVLTGRTVSWSSNNTGVATVNGSGLVSGIAVGSATITATSEGQSGTGQVTVTGPAPVASVEVTPANASIAEGATVQLTATPKDAAGNVLTGRTVSWSSSDGTVATVNASGLVSSVAAGSATITATSEGQSGTAQVTVTAPAPGGTVLFTEDFEDGSFGGRGWYDHTEMVTTAADAYSGSRSLEWYWQSGADYPVGATSAMRRLFTPSSTVYFSVWIKWSDNYIGSGSVTQPHEFTIITNEDGPYVSPAITHMCQYIEHVWTQGSGAGGSPLLGHNDPLTIDTDNIGVDLTGVTENRATGGCNGPFPEPDSDIVTSCYTLAGTYRNKKKIVAGPVIANSPGTHYKNQWNHIEYYVELNTIVGGIGQPDGIWRYWLNGELITERTNMTFRTGAYPNMMFNQFLLQPYIGDGSPRDQYVWIDNLVVATAPPSGQP